jgi:integrase
VFGLLEADINDPAKARYRWINILFRLYLEFLLNTGLRRSEALSPRMKHVDLGKGLIYVERTMEAHTGKNLVHFFSPSGLLCNRSIKRSAPGGT